MDCSINPGFTAFKWSPGKACCPYTRLGTPAKSLNNEKVWRSQEIAIALTLTVDLSVILLRKTSSVLPGKGVVYWNWQWNNLQGWVSNCVPLGKEELHTFHWDHIVLLQAGSDEMYYTLNGPHTTERREKVRVLSGSTASALSPGRHVWYMKLGQIHKAAVTLISKDQAIKLNFHRRGRSPHSIS